MTVPGWPESVSCINCGDFVDDLGLCVNVVDEPHDSGFKPCGLCTGDGTDGYDDVCSRCHGHGIVPKRLSVS